MTTSYVHFSCFCRHRCTGLLRARHYLRHSKNLEILKFNFLATCSLQTIFKCHVIKGQLDSSLDSMRCHFLKNLVRNPLGSLTSGRKSTFYRLEERINITFNVTIEFGALGFMLETYFNIFSVCIFFQEHIYCEQYAVGFL